MQLVWSDIWVLQALNSCAGEGDLDVCSLVVVADAINHAILTSEEFNNSIYRLGLADLINVDGKSVKLTSKSRYLFAKYAKQSIRKQADSLKKKLGAIGYSSDYDPNTLVAPKEFISKGRFNNAVQQYQQKFGI